MQKELRRSGRKCTLLPAKIQFNDKRSVFDCVVKNISSSGALLQVVSPIGIPGMFTLMIPSTEKRYLCWIVWSSMTELGVSFSALDPQKGKPDLQIVKS
jgi:hypothetical protein